MHAGVYAPSAVPPGVKAESAAGVKAPTGGSGVLVADGTGVLASEACCSRPSRRLMRSCCARGEAQSLLDPATNDGVAGALRSHGSGQRPRRRTASRSGVLVTCRTINYGVPDTPSAGPRLLAESEVLDAPRARQQQRFEGLLARKALAATLVNSLESLYSMDHMLANVAHFAAGSVRVGTECNWAFIRPQVASGIEASLQLTPWRSTRLLGLSTTRRPCRPHCRRAST